MKITALVFAVLMISLTASRASAQDAEKSAIDKFISVQATRKRGEEYADARKVVKGDLNGDDVAETVVLYTIEGENGGNNHVQYLVVFRLNNGKLSYATHTSVGGKGYRDVDLDSISNRLINLSTMGYAKNDPGCCPTLKGKAWYRLGNGRLVELKRPHS